MWFFRVHGAEDSADAIQLGNVPLPGCLRSAVRGSVNLVQREEALECWRVSKGSRVCGFSILLTTLVFTVDHFDTKAKKNKD